MASGISSLIPHGILPRIYSEIFSGISSLIAPGNTFGISSTTHLWLISETAWIPTGLVLNFLPDFFMYYSREFFIELSQIFLRDSEIYSGILPRILLGIPIFFSGIPLEIPLLIYPGISSGVFSQVFLSKFH